MQLENRHKGEHELDRAHCHTGYPPSRPAGGPIFQNAAASHIPLSTAAGRMSSASGCLYRLLVPQQAE
ncbi:hypothetical protein D3C73_1541820 [compost metagenome]